MYKKESSLHTLPADPKCVLEVDKTDGVESQRTAVKNRPYEVYPEISVDYEERLKISFPTFSSEIPLRPVVTKLVD